MSLRALAKSAATLTAEIEKTTRVMKSAGPVVEHWKTTLLESIAGMSSTVGGLSDGLYDGAYLLRRFFETMAGAQKAFKSGNAGSYYAHIEKLEELERLIQTYMRKYGAKGGESFRTSDYWNYKGAVPTGKGKTSGISAAKSTGLIGGGI